MIDFRNLKNNDIYYINTVIDTTDRSVGIYQNGIVFHYGRELSDKEIEWIRQEQAIANKAMEYIEKYQLERFKEKAEQTIEEVIDKAVQKVMAR